MQTFKNRTAEHKKKAKGSYNLPISNAIRKYGVENFDFEIIENVNSQKELNMREEYWIRYYNSMTPNGYNLTIGGQGAVGYKHTDDDKIKMSDLKRDMFKGEENPFYGKTHSAEQKEKWSKERRGRKLTPKWIENISKTRKRKKIVNLDTGEVFESARHFCRHYGKNPDSGTAGTVAKVCQKKPKFNTCLGYRLEYYESAIHDNTVPNLQFLKEGVTTIP